MRCEGVAALAALLALGGAGAQADAPLVVAGAAYESPGLLAPTLLVVAPRARGGSWRARLTGWTLGGEWRRVAGARRALVVAASLTPVNAHASNSLYRDGTKQPSLAYRNATLELALGLEARHGRWHRSELHLVGLHESVGGLGIAERRRWRAPFLGVEATHTVSHQRSDEPLGAFTDGWKAFVRGRGLTGVRSFGQLHGGLSAGRRMGWLLLRGDVTGHAGAQADSVSASLVGGSWDGVAGAVYGYRYAEFRVPRGLVATAGADAALSGEWRLGVRAGYLRAPGLERRGYAVRLGSRLSGVALHAGAGLPHDSLRRGTLRHGLLFSGATVALFVPRR